MTRSIAQEVADRATQQRRELRARDFRPSPPLPLPPHHPLAHPKRRCPDCGYVSCLAASALPNLGNRCPECWLDGDSVEMVPTGATEK